MPFKEIAFRAELNRELDPECEHHAFIHCGEDPSRRAWAIEELKSLIYGRGQCKPPRIDDSFLLRFLRARGCIPARAHRLMVRYCQFREQNPSLWRDVYWYGLTRLDSIIEGVLYDRPDVGRLIICKLGLWDPGTIPVEDLIRGCLLLLEIGIMQPKLQVLGGTTLLDCQGIGLKHIRQLSPSVASQAISLMGLAFPIYQHGVHVINCSSMYQRVFSVFKRLSPGEELWKCFHFHGYDTNSLHKYVDPECLPKQYGGCRDTVSLREWLTKIKQYKNKQFDDDMRSLGYAV